MPILINRLPRTSAWPHPCSRFQKPMFLKREILPDFETMRTRTCEAKQAQSYDHQNVGLNRNDSCRRPLYCRNNNPTQIAQCHQAITVNSIGLMPQVPGTGQIYIGF